MSLTKCMSAVFNKHGVDTVDQEHLSALITEHLDIAGRTLEQSLTSSTGRKVLRAAVGQALADAKAEQGALLRALEDQHPDVFARPEPAAAAEDAAPTTKAADDAFEADIRDQLAATGRYDEETTAANASLAATMYRVLRRRAGRPLPPLNVRGDEAAASLEQGPKKRGPGSDIGHKREKGSGRYVGAPDWIGTSPQQLAVLRKKLRQLANEGERGRYWYEKSSRAILAMFNGDKIEAERFVGLIALYSPNAQVPANTSMALNAYLQWKAGLPIKAGLGDGNRKAQALLDRNEWWDGIKTNSFYQNLMVEIDPSKLDPGVATMDMWMAIAADYGMKSLDQGPKYKFLEREIRRLADELGWEAHQVQAAIWTGIKARVDPIRDQLRAKEKTLGWVRYKPKVQDSKANAAESLGTVSIARGLDPNAGLWSTYRKVPQTIDFLEDIKPEHLYDHYRLAHKMGMAREVPATEETDDAKTDYADVLQTLTVQLSWEATPSTTTGRSLPGIHKASLAEKLEYLVAVRAALTENGRDLVAALAGLPPGVAVQGLSAWQGALGAGMQTFLPVPLEGAANKRHIKKVATDLLDLYSTLLGYVLEQDMVVYHAPVWADAIKSRNGVELRTTRPLDANEMAVLYNMLHNEFGTWGLAPGWRPDGVRILNFEDGLSNKDFQAGVERVIAQLPDTFGGRVVDHAFFRSDGNYISNNWRSSPNGEEYLARINARRPDLQGRVERLRARVAAVNGFFAERYGWDDPNRFTGGRLFQSDVRGGGDGRGVPAREVWRSVPRYAGGQAKGAVSEAAIHFSSESRTELDSAFWGRGMKDAAAQRVKDGDDPRLQQRIYFYLDNGSGVKPESGVGFNAHAVTLDNLYDAVADPLGLARGRSANEFESAVLDAGFDGYISRVGSGSSARRAAVLLGERKVPVKAIGYAHEANQALAARREQGAQGDAYFAPEAMQEARDLLNAWKSRETLVYMSPDDFLALAEGLDGPAPEKAGPIAERLRAGQTFESLPFLNFSHDDDTGVATVTGHEGRHRAMALRERGVTQMPVLLRSTAGRTIRWGQQSTPNAFDRIKTWPTELVGEDGRTRRPFPVTDPLTALNQDETAPRGAYDLGAWTVRLLAGADKSTFVHELGHHYLEILAQLAAEPDANAGIKADMQDLLDWFGVESVEAWQGMSLEEKRPYHEQFARGFEAYLAEGKAPTPQLEGIFARFKEWLLEVYQSLRDLDVELTPEVRKVFDRMLTEETPVPQAAPAAPQTGTAAFKKWFGNSKVVDENGEPLVVYHGTNADFDTFDAAFQGSSGQGSGEQGFFFDSSPENASRYVRADREGSNVLPAYLALRNPLVIERTNTKYDYDGTFNRVAFNNFIDDALEVGHDGVVFRDVLDRGKRSTQYVVFRPEQIKSATGNRGTFSAKSPNILEQRAPRRPADPVLAEALDLIGLGRPKTLPERIKTYLSGGWGQIRADLAAASGHLKTGVFDKFNPIKQAELRLLGNLPAEQSSYVAARFSTGLSSLLRGVLMYGAPEWRGGIAQRVAGSKGLLDILSPVADDINDWLGWMVGMRAERLKGEGRENLLSDDHIAKLKALAGPAGSEKARRFQQVARDFAGFKRAVLDFAQTAGLIDATTRPAWDLADWIPFYRVMEDQGGGVRGPRNTQGLGWQSSGIRQLKGGESAMNDPLANILQNFAHLLDASMKNHAVRLAVQNFDGYGVFQELKVSERMGRALIPLSEVKRHLKEAGVDTRTLPQVALEGIAKMWSFQTPEGKDVIRVMMDGKARYFHVTDPEMLRALTAVDETAFGGIFKAFRFTKRLLTGAVTADPAFIARNFIRDMLHAWTINPDGMRIGIDSVRGLTKTLTETGGAIDMAFAGASFMGGYLNANDPTEVARSIRRALRDKGLSASAIDKHLATVIDTPVKLWEMYRRLGDSVENASREAAYAAALKAGKSKAQAAFEAKDLMDYSMRGQWAAIRALTDMLPFFNARLQGLYKLGRSGALPGPGIKTKVVAKGLTITLATLALMLANKDREEYDELEDWDKDAYWHFWVDDEHLRLPKPFEIGLIYGTVPERLFRRFWTGQDDNEKLMRRLMAGMSDTLAFDPRPQLAKPIMEVISNKNAFTGRDIENIRDEGVFPSQRYNEGTSETARWLGERFSDDTGVSPKQFEHLIRGYFGTIGSYVLGISDLVVREARGMPTAPALRPDQIAVVGAFYRGSGPARSTRHQTEFYEMLREATQAYRSVRALREEGLVEQADQLAAEQATPLENRKLLDKTSDRLSKIRKQLESISRDPDLTAREKRMQIDELLALRNDLVRDTVRAVAEAR